MTRFAFGIYMEMIVDKMNVKELIEDALTPFAHRVFNDNGDLTVDKGGFRDQEPFIRAYFAKKRLSEIVFGYKATCKEGHVFTAHEGSQEICPICTDKLISNLKTENENQRQELAELRAKHYG